MEGKGFYYNILGLGILSTLILFYVLGRQGGKKKGGEVSTNQAPVPDPNHIDPNLDIPGFSKTLYDSMKGVNVIDRGRVDNFRKLFNLNDSEFIAVYNRFNSTHGEGKSLRQWIAEEWIGITGDSIKSKLDIRFEALNLS